MIAAAVPLKSLSAAKSRLASHLSPDERLAIVTDLVERTIEVLRACGVFERIALATPETTLARRLAVDVIEDRGTLNGAIEDTQRWALDVGTTGLLVVPADLPLLSADDVLDLLDAARPMPALTIAPTRDGGTGALLMQPPNVIRPHFGPQSFRLHCRAAEAEGAAVSVVMREGFAAELDTVEDLKIHRLHLS